MWLVYIYTYGVIDNSDVRHMVVFVHQKLRQGQVRKKDASYNRQYIDAI